jgi:hypothetical protein
MNSDKQRIAIAEACGWKDVRGVTHLGIPPEGGRLFPYPEYHQEDWRLKPFRGIPDYLNDLNAMHEAEKMLKGNTQWYKYEETLEAIIRADTAHWPIHATAAYRAEAFLKTIGKWEE